MLGSQRLSEPEFDEGTAVVSKGGWGLFLSTFIVSQAGFIFLVLLRHLFGRKDCTVLTAKFGDNLFNL